MTMIIYFSFKVCMTAWASHNLLAMQPESLFQLQMLLAQPATPNSSAVAEPMHYIVQLTAGIIQQCCAINVLQHHMRCSSPAGA